MQPLGRVAVQSVPGFSRQLRGVSTCQWIYRRKQPQLAFHTFTSDFGRYRQPSKDVWEELQVETERTHHYINQELKDEIALEIQQAATQQDNIPGELGSTGGYLYLTTDDNHGCRKFRRKDIKTGQEHDFLEISLLEARLLAMSLSVDECYVAFLTSQNSTGTTTVRVRSLETGEEIIVPTTGLNICNIEWGARKLDGRHSLFYTSSNLLGRPDTVQAVCLSHEQTMRVTESRQIYHNENEAVMVDIQRTKGCQYVAVNATTKTSNEIFLVADPHRPPILVRSRQESVQYHVDVGQRGDVFVLANATVPDHPSGLTEELSIFQAKITDLPLAKSFGIFLDVACDEYVVSDCDIFHDFIALYERSIIDGKQRIRIKSRSLDHGRETRVVPFPKGTHDCATVSPGGNMCYLSTDLRFSMESPCSPSHFYSYNTQTGDLISLSSDLEQLSLSPYAQKRLLVTSRDGTHVPLSLIYTTDPKLPPGTSPRRRPTVLIGYGSYGEPVYSGFDPSIVPLLDRGFVVAYAHSRGGGDLGRAWYRAGRLYNKHRSIEDYLACAEALVGILEISDPDAIAAKGFSAGGVMIAAAVNQQPDLFSGVVLTNPFLDVSLSATRTDLPLTEHEWDEWGNPETDSKAVASISSYCPMSNLSPQPYPPMLLIGTLDDASVPYWHPVIFAFKVRQCTADTTKQAIRLHIEPTGGHHLYGRRLDVAALEIVFILQTFVEHTQANKHVESNK